MADRGSMVGVITLGTQKQSGVQHFGHACGFLIFGNPF